MNAFGEDNNGSMREHELELEVARLNAELDALKGEGEPAEIAARFLTMAASTVDQAMEDARREADDLAAEVSAAAEARRDEATRIAEEAEARTAALRSEAEDHEAVLEAAQEEAEAIKSDAEATVAAERVRVAEEVERLAAVRTALEAERGALETYHDELKRRVQELAESMVQFMTTEPPLAAVTALDGLAAAAIEPTEAALGTGDDEIDTDDVAEADESVEIEAADDDTVSPVADNPFAPTATVDADASDEDEPAEVVAEESDADEVAEVVAEESDDTADDESDEDEVAEIVAEDADDTADEDDVAVEEIVAESDESDESDADEDVDAGDDAEIAAELEETDESDESEDEDESPADDRSDSIVESFAAELPDSSLAPPPAPVVEAPSFDAAPPVYEPEAPVAADPFAATPPPPSPFDTPAFDAPAPKPSLFGSAAPADAADAAAPAAPQPPAPSFTDMMKGSDDEAPTEEFGGVPVVDGKPELPSRRKRGGLFSRARSAEVEETAPLPPAPTEASTGLFGAHASRLIEQTSAEDLRAALADDAESDEQFRSFLDGDDEVDPSRDWLLRPEQG